MDEEKLQRTMEFILNNQAQFSVDIQKLQEVNKDAEKRISVLERATVNFFNALTDTNKNISAVAEKVDVVADKVDKLADFQKETDNRLNAVILMVEKFLSGQNGNSKNEK